MASQLVFQLLRGRFGEMQITKWLWLSKPMGHFGGRVHQSTLVGIGMFTGGTIWILTHAQVATADHFLSDAQWPRDKQGLLFGFG